MGGLASALNSVFLVSIANYQTSCKQLMSRLSESSWHWYQIFSRHWQHTPCALTIWLTEIYIYRLSLVIFMACLSPPGSRSSLISRGRMVLTLISVGFICIWGSANSLNGWYHSIDLALCVPIPLGLINNLGYILICWISLANALMLKRICVTPSNLFSNRQRFTAELSLGPVVVCANCSELKSRVIRWLVTIRCMNACHCSNSDAGLTRVMLKGLDPSCVGIALVGNNDWLIWFDLSIVRKVDNAFIA